MLRNEQKQATYPRTDSHYLTEDMAEGLPELCESEVAALLGLSEDTVLLLSELAAHEPKGVLDAVDDAVYAVLDAIQMAREA